MIKVVPHLMRSVISLGFAIFGEMLWVALEPITVMIRPIRRIAMMIAKALMHSAAGVLICTRIIWITAGINA